MFNFSSRPPRPSAPQQERRQLQLTVVGTARSYDLDDSVIIGSHASCDLQINDDKVGGRHAEIYQAGPLWWIRDLGSVDGTFVRGEVVEAEPLEGPSEIQLGADGPILFLRGLDDARVE